jgi:PAS domain S-box-containing protein
MLHKNNETIAATLFDALDDAVLIHPLMKEGFAPFTFVNQVALDRYGYSRDEFYKITATDITHKIFSDVHTKEENRADLARKKRKRFEAIHIRKDRTEFFVEINSTVWEYEGKKMILSVVRDISDRKEDENKLRASEQKYRFIADSSPLAIYISSGESQVADYINPTFFNLFGYKHEEVSNLEKWLKKAYPSDEYRKKIGTEWSKRITKAIKTSSQIEPMETVVTCKDGSEKNIQWGFVSMEYSDWSFGLDLTEYRKAEKQSVLEKKKVEENETKFKAIFDNTFSFMGLLDLQGKIIDINETALKFIGKDIEEVRNQLFVESGWWLHSETERKKIGDVIACAIRTGEMVQVESTSIGINNEIKSVDFNVKPIYDSNNQMLYLLAEGRDITPLKQTEERLNHIMEATQDGIWERNLETHEVYYSPKFKSQLGFKNHELEERLELWEERVDPKGLAIANEKISKILAGESNLFESEFKMKKKDGSWIDIFSRGVVVRNNQGKPYRFVGTHVDITESKKTQKQLEYAQEIAKLGNWLYDVNTKDVSWSDEMYRINGLPISEHAPSKEKWLEHVISEDRTFVKNKLDESIENQMGIDIIFRVKKFDTGEIRWIHKRGEFHYNEGTSPYLIGVAQDITELKLIQIELEDHKNNLEDLVKEKTENLEDANEELTAINSELTELNTVIIEKNTELEETIEKLKQAQLQLVQSEKMASLGVLTAGVAHEINNPLNYIMGAYVGLNKFFEKEAPENKEKADFLLDSIKIGLDKASNIVKSLGQFSRTNTNNNEDCDIHKIIDNCLTMLYNSYKHTATIYKDYQEYLPILQCNSGKIHQVFLNILTNAIQSIQAQGTVTIRTRKKADNIEIKISDTGCGIKKEDLNKIIEPFYTTKAPGVGTGLGLSITYSIISEHNGNIKFESEIDIGTTVFINLPITNN